MTKIFSSGSRKVHGAIIFFVTCLMCSHAQEANLQLWQKPYAGADAAGESVLGLWQIASGAETADSSGKGHVLKLRGSGVCSAGANLPLVVDGWAESAQIDCLWRAFLGFGKDCAYFGRVFRVVARVWKVGKIAEFVGENVRNRLSGWHGRHLQVKLG